MQYIYGKKKCIRNLSTHEVFRASFVTATQLVNAGLYSFTSKGAWKSGGKQYYETS